MSSNWTLAVFVALVTATGASGIFFRPGAWYQTLNKPDWTPPDWVFGPVWTVLYVMIALAGWLAWRERGMGLEVGLWGTQLVVNALWSYFFFGLRRIDIAFVDVVLMWLSIAAFIAVTATTVVWAAVLFVPYLVWVTIAATLNLTIWRLNPGAV